MPRTATGRWNLPSPPAPRAVRFFGAEKRCLSLLLLLLLLCRLALCSRLVLVLAFAGEDTRVGQYTTISLGRNGRGEGPPRVCEGSSLS